MEIAVRSRRQSCSRWVRGRVKIMMLTCRMTVARFLAGVSSRQRSLRLLSSRDWKLLPLVWVSLASSPQSWKLLNDQLSWRQLNAPSRCQPLSSRCDQSISYSLQRSLATKKPIAGTRVAAGHLRGIVTVRWSLSGQKCLSTLLWIGKVCALENKHGSSECSSQSIRH
ncbi:hypothetical protein HDK90DRAFT_495769 [Phyllosticta capitalensis]|uniref:Uncharacterized protein n=1 Tax=Phyllosticta capitalensis TaxID=121624 RepID=A0ABR1YC29_9PEZI